MWVFFGLAIIIVVLVFIIWFLPKAFKDWNVSWGKGFTRIYYYFVAGPITLFLAVVVPEKNSGVLGTLFLWALFFLLAVMVFKSFTWVFGAFIKKKK